MPELRCPFPARVNRYAEIAHRHTLEWVRRFGLVTDKNALRRLETSRFGWLAARAYPNAALEELMLVSDWNTWLFIRDDQCDETGLGKEPARLTAVHERLLGILMGRPCAPEDGALGQALDDLWSRMRAKASLSWEARFIHSMEEYFESSAWEANNRARGICPDVATYTKMRPYTGGLYTDIELIEITEQITLPLEIRKHPVIEQLALMTNNVVCWSNDIISLTKELEHLEQHLPKFSSHHAQAVHRYVDVLRSWMRGNLDWAYESARYRTVQTDPIPCRHSEKQLVGASL